MKKLVFFLLAAAALCSCESNDEPCPVTGVELPASSAENPVQPGMPVTIQGQGFSEDSEIWLRTVARVADVQAEVTGASATGITFVAPEVSGAQTVVLKQNGGEWSLGKMYFAEETDNPGGEEIEILPRKIVGMKVSHKESNYGPTTTNIPFEYDAEGRLVAMSETMFGNGKATFSYSEGHVVTECGGRKVDYTLENGRAVSYSLDDNDDPDEPLSLSGKIAYDAANYISGITYSTTKGYKTEADIVLSYTNGTLRKYELTETYRDGKDGKYFQSWNVTPSEVVNNTKLDLFGVIGAAMGLEDDGWYEFVPAYLLNIGGNRTHCLPSVIELKYDDGGYKGTNTQRFEYAMTDEYVSKITIDSTDVSEDGTESEQYTIEIRYEE